MLIEAAARLQPAMSILFYIFGIGGVVAAYMSLRANRQNQREANARRAYLEYARLGFDHPDFAFPLHLEVDFEEQTVRGNKLDFERYEWFVSNVLGTVRFFLESVSRRSMWRNMMVLQLAYHWEYLERFRDKKEYLKRWAVELGPEFDEAIILGRRLYPR